ncbi:DUF2203 domain-containing protein [Sorangium sp. So ce590]|uniref:DUF2203 domain-containing protein n=1 Tax=unclassified Sorangium TaxID=2621164 RepID=UPI003F5D9976
MNTPRIWTIEEANALVPELSSLIRRQLALASDIERSWQELVHAVQSPAVTPDQLIELARSGSEQARARERALSEKIAAYESGWQEVEELGVVVKDQRIGLCDFYGRLGDALVWLCWRYGEPAVDHYHGLEAGYAGRRPITAATRRQLLN